MAVLQKGTTLFPAELTTDLINKVRGKSALAELSNQEPIPFNGTDSFVFTLDSEIDVVAESGKKSHGGVTVEPVSIRPIKVEYGARVSDEFMFASEESKINILKAFNDGFAKKIAKGLDLMALHGLNPRQNTSSAVIGENHLDAKATQTVELEDEKHEEAIESAVATLLGADHEPTGLALAPAFSSGLAKLKVNGVKQYPELAWGANPGNINGLPVAINRTHSAGEKKEVAIIGDFENLFRWGYAKEITMEVIPYGDPDNSGTDLKGHNQVYLRAEAYLGWGILDGNAFVRIVTK